MTAIEIENFLKERESEEQKNPDLYKSRFELFYDGYKNGEISYKEFEPEIQNFGNYCKKIGKEVGDLVVDLIKKDLDDFLTRTL